MTREEIQRYSRQLQLNEFGIASQQRLKQMRVLVIGAGGLGCPCLLYLAAAGCGYIGIADSDVVELHNLPRQILFNSGDLKKNKAECTVEKLRHLNENNSYIAHAVRITQKNILDLAIAYDVVVDATDNFESRYMINDALALLNKPLIYAAVYKQQFQLALFNGINSDTRSNLRYYYPSAPVADQAATCSDTGVLNSVTGIAGICMVNEILKLCSQEKSPLQDHLLLMDLSGYQSMMVKPADPGKLDYPKDERAFLAYSYTTFCHQTSNV